jgi:FKBP-type peptidyl-prolyl cis-trans isomerase FkpA
MSRFLLALGALAMILVAGCTEDAVGPRHVACDPLLITFGPAPADTVTLAGGLRYVDLQVGAGQAAAQWSQVDVNYTGYLPTGAVFDTSCPADREVFRTVLGPGGSIEGFWRGIEGMRAGGIRRIVIPPALGYGGAPGHPLQNSTLIFDVQLIGIR